MNKKLIYNLHGYMIEFNANNRLWTWNKWDYREGFGEKKVVRHSGTLQFKKIFKSVFEGGNENITLRDGKQLEEALDDRGVDYAFLFLGETRVEERFSSVKEAEKFYNLDSCPHWDLTDYWFGFDWDINSWAMYDAFTGALQFTPDTLLAQRSNKIVAQKPQQSFVVDNCFYHDPGPTTH